MRRALFAAAMLAILSAATGVRPSAQGCNDCKPPRLNRGWDVRAGSHTVCFESNQHHSWSETQRNQMRSGFDWQKGLLASSGRNVTFTYTHAVSGQSCSSDAIEVVALDCSTTAYPDQAGAAHGTSNGEGARIEINKKHVGGGPLPEHRWDYVAAHDFGHLAR